MVTAVSGSLLSALLPGSPAATKLAQQNAVLPSPVQTPEEQAKQRSSALLKFDRPQVAQSTFSDLQDSGLRNFTISETGSDANASGGDANARALQAYQAVQQSLRPLQELATPPRPVPNPAALAPGAAEEKDKKDERASSRISDDERARERNNTRETQNEPGIGSERGIGIGSERATGFASIGNSTRDTAASAPSTPGISLGAQVDLGA